jgi:hypothetical protein
MTDFEMALREQLKKLDADHEWNRRILLDAIASAAGRNRNGHADVATVITVPHHGSGQPPAPRRATSDDKNQMAEVKAAIMTFGDAEFTKNDIRARLKDLKPDISENVLKNMSSFLWYLHKKEGFLAVKMQGKGHKQSVYAKL